MKIILSVMLLAAGWPVAAQQQVTPAATYGAKETKKKERFAPVFWSATRQQPPLPFHPFPDLPVFDAGINNFVYDDRAVDYPALNAARAK